MSLDQIPDEIIQHLLYYVSARDTLHTFQLLSHRLHRLSNEPLLWRHHCCDSFKYWHPDHRLHDKVLLKVSHVDWKRLFVLRKSRNARVSHLFEAVLTTKVGRLKRFEEISRLGYDAKDFLLEQCQTDERAEDVLARRHYSNAILDSIHRSLAVEEWSKLRMAGETRDAGMYATQLERGLGAFDMFVLHDQPGDFDDISRMFDEKAAQFRHDEPQLSNLTTRQKALVLNRWLRANNLTGMHNPERNYRNLRNCLIGQALRHDEHESIPIVSSAIFCCMAARVGIMALCCAFPGHVHAIVYSPAEKTLDDLPQAQGEPRQKMYLDPYGLDDEVSTSTLQDVLARVGWQPNTELAMAPVPSHSIALRTAHNIRETAPRIIELQDQAHPELSQLLHGNSALNVEASLYSSLWASLMLTPANTIDWDHRLANFLRRFAISWPEDAWLVEKYLWPMYNNFAPLREGFARHANRGLTDPWEHWRLVREQDSQRPPVNRRDAPGNEAVPFKIGQVFRHRRYGWIGVVTGWSDQGTRHLPVPHAHGVRQPLEAASSTQPRTRAPNQFFFMCFPSTGSEPLVVATESIDLIRDPAQVADGMFPLAGKFFKRFDPASCTFVSNIKEQYPDD